MNDADGKTIAADDGVGPLDARRLTDSWTVARSALWNIAGRAGPMVVALIATPFLFADLGPTRWGLFTLALSLIGIFGIFDFGIGRALTKLLAEKLVQGEIEEAAALTRTGVVLLTLLGALGAMILAALAPLWVDHALRVPVAERTEVVHALYILCVAVPFVILNAALWGVISAFQKFRAANLVNMPILAFYYVGPLMVLRVVDSLVVVMMVLVACRFVMTYFYWRICITEMPSLISARADWRHAGALAKLGGWMTVSNLTWPVLLYVDRFLVASVVSAAAAGYYTTPSDLLGRFSLVTVAVMGTAFPALAASYKRDPTQAATLLRRSLLAIVGILFLPSLIIVAFSHEILTLWVGAAFAAPAAPVMQWLAVAVVLTAADAVVSGFIDSIGRPDVNAKFSLVELCLYVPILVGLMSLFGIKGAAVAWTVRIGIDFAVRVAIASRLAPGLASRFDTHAGPRRDRDAPGRAPARRADQSRPGDLRLAGGEPLSFRRMGLGLYRERTGLLLEPPQTAYGQVNGLLTLFSIGRPQSSFSRV